MARLIVGPFLRAMLASSLLVAWGLRASAQAPDKPRGRPEARVLQPEAQAPPAPGQTLVIVAVGEAGEQAKTLRTQIQQGTTLVLHERGLLGPSEEFDPRRIDVKDIDEDTYNVLKRFINEGTMPNDVPQNRLFLARARGDAWTLDLGGPYTLTSLEVLYKKDGVAERASKLFTPEKGENVRIVTIGRYLINGVKQTDTKLVPAEFIIRSKDGGRDRPEERIEAPAENTYWQIVIRDFAGDQKALFEVLASNKFGNPLVSTQLSERKLVLGSLLLADIQESTTITDNIVRFQFQKPESEANRLYIKFPLEADEVAGELERYRRDFDYFELPEQIRKESPSAADDNAKLAPRPAAARWYEILPSEKGLGFVRSFELENIDGWKARADKKVYRLVVWTLDNPGQKPQAIRLKNDGETRASPIHAEEVVKWPVEIRGARLPTAR